MEMAMAIDTPSPSPSALAGRWLSEEERWRRFGEEEDGEITANVNRNALGALDRDYHRSSP
uniref:Uncharacterized protein n=1 Tax=Oryza rufipogon TaxID=4529 RepID=A0A0E0R6V3_ORYRU